MSYDRELAMQICKELGIKWNPDAKEATVVGDPIPVSLKPDDVFVVGFYEGEDIGGESAQPTK